MAGEDRWQLAMLEEEARRWKVLHAPAHEEQLSHREVACGGPVAGASSSGG